MKPTHLTRGCLALFGMLVTVLAWGSEPEPLSGEAIETLVSGNTAACRREKDQEMCSNYFSDEGVVKRIMHDDGALKEGRWFIDDNDRLCILWLGKIRPLCFLVTAQPDGSYVLTKRGRHLTTITAIETGNTEGL